MAKKFCSIVPDHQERLTRERASSTKMTPTLSISMSTTTAGTTETLITGAEIRDQYYKQLM